MNTDSTAKHQTNGGAGPVVRADLPPALLRALLERAARALHLSLGGGEASSVSLEGPPPDPRLAEHRGIFVTLRQEGALRGCIGEVTGRQPLWDGVVRMARAAAFEDPRFDSLAPADLASTTIEVSVLSPLRPTRPEQFELGREGLMLRAPEAHGLLLPQVAREHGLDREGFLEALCRKSGLGSGAWRSGKEQGVELQAFTVQAADGAWSELVASAQGPAAENETP